MTEDFLVILPLAIFLLDQQEILQLLELIIPSLVVVQDFATPLDLIIPSLVILRDVSTSLDLIITS